MLPLSSVAVRPGFADPVLESQHVFRVILEAMSRPGTIGEICCSFDCLKPLDSATAAVVLALADYETPVWLDASAATDEAIAHLRFHCGCPLADDPRQAVFAVIADPSVMPPATDFCLGDDAYPDRSTTLIVQVPALTGGTASVLRGPGIATSQIFAPQGLPAAFPDWARDNHAHFPRGVDFVFTSGRRIMALPRSTRLED